MADEQDKGASTAPATANAGATPGDAPKTSYSADDLQREADRRVSEAQKKWKEQLDSTVADKTRDAEAKLAELSSKAEEAERYAAFIEAATAAGVRNVKAAYAVAKHAGDYINKAGVFDAKKFRADNPEFFAPAPNANAGAGAGAATNAGGMNAFIRSAAGRG